MYTKDEATISYNKKNHCVHRDEITIKQWVCSILERHKIGNRSHRMMQLQMNRIRICGLCKIKRSEV